MHEHDKKELDIAADNVVKGGLLGPAIFGIVSFVSPAIAVAALPIALPIGLGALAAAAGWKGYRHLSKDDNK